jgi:hypothetical protein
MMSAVIVKALQSDPVTDVFILSHGWQGDVPAAREQYDAWIDAMGACQTDIAEMKRVRPGFRPLIVGLHWPSRAWGDEEFGSGDGNVSFSAPATDPVEAMVEQYAERLDATAEGREALRTIITSAAQEIAPPEMPADVRAAYELLEKQSLPASEGEGADPGADRDPFDARRCTRRRRKR